MAKFESTKAILKEVLAERGRQEQKWGVQNHSILHPETCYEPSVYKKMAELHKIRCEARSKDGVLSWYDILMEEVYEVFAEETSENQREELIQVAAVAVQMVEYLDRTNKNNPST